MKQRISRKLKKKYKKMGIWKSYKSVKSSFRIRAKEELESSRNKAYKLLVP